MHSALTGLLAILVSKSMVSSAAVNEPPNGKVYLSAWLDTANWVDSTGNLQTGDRPLAINTRMGLNISVFQYAQDLPINGEPGYMRSQVDKAYDDALMYITVYPIVSHPRSGRDWDMTDFNITQLADQCKDLNNNGRRLLLRLGPEMNGEWMTFGASPTKFIELWRKVYTAVKAAAPRTDLVWAPNAGNGYPWSVHRGMLTPEDFLLLDTNKNGFIDGGDDPYEPYWPGDEYVDWVGASNYHFGSAYPYTDNVIPRPGDFESNINSYNLYDTFSAKKNKPFMIAETGAAWHPREPVGPGELPIKQAWWRQTITNEQLLNKYPLIKLFCMFEFSKYEGPGNSDLRDFRISHNPEVREAFKKDFSLISHRYVTTNYTVPFPDPYAVPPRAATTTTSVAQKDPEATALPKDLNPVPLKSGAEKGSSLFSIAAVGVSMLTQTMAWVLAL